MRFGSVCSGIEAASCAWHPLGWKAQFVSEIEPFPSAVLAHHYPTVDNRGDMTKFKDWPDATLDLLVGGTPCQSFSVAGLRKGLADPRGNLMLTYLAIAARWAPRWLVWENVPGVLSSNGGRDFGTLLGGLAELGYGFAYRILDAQYFGVAQRRRRVFLVGRLGDWRRAAAVLFERESMLGHPAPSRESRQGIAGTLASGAHPGGHNGQDDDGKFLVAHSLRGEGFDASEDGTGRGTPLVPVSCLHADALGRTGTATTPSADAEGRVRLRDPGLGIISDGTAYNLMASGQPHAVAFAENSRAELRLEGGDGRRVGAISTGGGKPGQGVPMIATAFSYKNPNAADDFAPCLDAGGGGGMGSGMSVHHGSAVRRLTPRECERLQGFPDDYTLINVRGKQAADGPRYKALGNSMAVPVMRWIGERIQAVDEANGA